MTRLILVRHAEAEGNINRVLHGWTDSRLTEKGMLQAKCVADRLKSEEIDAIYASDLKRAYHTAEFIADAKHLDVYMDEGLRELNCGEFEDKPFLYLNETFVEEMNHFNNELHLFCAPSGESTVEFQKRLISTVNKILLKHPDESICIVTHGTAIRALLCYFYSKPLDEIVNIYWGDNTSISIITIDQDEFNVEIESDSNHLGSELATITYQEWYKNKGDKK